MNGRQHRIRTTWLGRFVRGHRLDRNPLRRGYDRLETAILATLVIAFLAAVPFATQASAAATWSAGHQAQLAQRASRYQVPATVVRREAPGYMTAKIQAQVRWTARDGQVRTGEELVPAGARAGMTVRVWIDGTGQLSEAPLTGTQVSDQAYLTGMAVVLLFAVATAAAGILSHRALDRRRMAAWEAEWRGAGPRWTTRA